MKILVVGSGGREHALVYKIAESPKVKKVYCAPGNGGISDIAECVDIKAGDIPGLINFAKREKIDLTVVGPEAPLVAGIVDEFTKEGLKAFGPTKKAARLEASKDFSKKLMRDCGVPTAGFVTCRNMSEFVSAMEGRKLPVVVKADGLAAGKGVVICATKEEALEAAESMLEKKIFGDSGASVVLEDYLLGEEASILVLTNGREALPLASSQDHKRIFDGDKGPNTGGMGAYSPAPLVTDGLLEIIMKKIVEPVISRMEKTGSLYRGILYAGIMVTKDGPKVLEFNVRFGDPETQAVLTRLDSDIIDAFLWAAGFSNEGPRLKWKESPAVCVVVSSGGYPGKYENGKEIKGLDKVSKLKDVVVFHAGTKKSGGKYYTNGGRVLGVTGLGSTLREALDKAYGALGEIKFDEMHYRNDIAWRALSS